MLILTVCALDRGQHKLLRRKQHRCLASGHCIDVITKLFSLCLCSCDNDRNALFAPESAQQMSPVYMGKTRHRDG